jgi:hypothetical protein
MVQATPAKKAILPSVLFVSYLMSQLANGHMANVVAPSYFQRGLR